MQAVDMRTLIALTALLLVPSAHAAITAVFDGALSCTVQADGVRFCGNTSPRSTVRAFDGVPIDVNVAFPPAPASGPDGSFPLVMMFHGYGGSKLGLGQMRRWLDWPPPSSNPLAQACRLARISPDGRWVPGYIRLMDTRYGPSAQDFAGALADEDSSHRPKSARSAAVRRR
jgi:hypothetical protein